MIDTKDWTIEKVYQAILNRQLAGVMLHNDACLFMHFLGFENMGCMQSCRKEDESENLEATTLYYLNKYGYMMQAENSERADLIPQEAYNTASKDVGNEYKRKTIAKFMDTWFDWETETEELYAAAVSWCCRNQLSDVHHFNGLLKDVCLERQTVQKMIRYMKLTSYDLGECEKAAKESCY